MKYIKKFEKLLKKTDSKVLNNPLYEFSNKLENILIHLKELDNFKESSVKKYFSDYQKITISYGYYQNLFKIVLIPYDDDVMLIITYADYIKFDTDIINSQDLFEFIKLKLKKYTITELFKSKEAFKFPMTEINNVISKIEEYHKYLDLTISTNKYNL